MSNKAPLLKMILFVMVIIFLAVIFSKSKSRKITYDINNSFFKKYIIWQNNSKAYTILLHSIILNDSSMSAYSAKFDSVINFPIPNNDHNIVHNKLGHMPYTNNQCIKCHNIHDNN